MASPSISIQDSRGFTLFESLIVISIFIIIMGVVGVASFNSYKGYLFRSERTTLVSVLERARSRAMANYYETSHGVKYDADSHSYYIYRGPTFDPDALTNEKIEGSPKATITGLDTVLFTQLTGKVSVGGPSSGCESGEQAIKVNESDQESYVCINSEGRINW